MFVILNVRQKPEKPSHPDVFSASRCLAPSSPGCPLPGGTRHFGSDPRSALPGAVHPRSRLPTLGLGGFLFFSFFSSTSLHMDDRSN